MKHQRNVLTRTALGLSAMFGVYWLYSCLLQPVIKLPFFWNKMLGILCLYGVGLGLFLFIATPFRADRYLLRRSGKKKISLGSLALCLLLQCTALMILSLLTNLLSAWGMQTSDNPLEMVSLYSLFMLLLFNPIMEELVFRQLLAKLLLPHGECLYMLASSFCFAIVHCVSIGPAQVIYTFILGLIWSWLMVRTGSLVLVIVMHSLSNLFGGVMLQLLMVRSMAAAGIWSMLLMAMGAAGLCVFLAKRKKLSIDGDNRLFRKQECRALLTNPGILCYTALTVAMMLVKNFT